MDLEWLDTFVTAAATENFHQAARLRFLNQATVSHHIARLEESLGRPLFSRHGRRVSLTPAGHMFLPYAERMIQLWSEGQQRILAAHAAPRLSIAATSYTADTVIPWLAETSLRHHPDLDLDIKIVDSGEAVAAVLAGTVDAGIIRDVPHVGPLDQRILIHDRLALAVPADGRDWDNPPPPADDLLHRTRILVQPTGRYWPTVLQRLEHLGYYPRRMDVDDIAITKKLIASGIGVSVLPEMACQRESIEGRLVLLYPDWLSDLRDRIYWITVRDRPPSEPVAWLETVLDRRFPKTHDRHA